jgi:16S rRNA (guanine527-N7)-methyltransferase
MVSEASLAQLLAPFGLELSAWQSGQVLEYLELLMRWNRKINLTAIRSAEECVTRHFGECLFASTQLHLEGRLLDIGSGAGFPGLALKIPFPYLAVTLLEPVTKKRAFLKEVARVCHMDSIEVRGERLDDFAGSKAAPAFETVTSRAVGQLDRLIPVAVRCLVPGGRLCLWVTRDQTTGIAGISPRLSWGEPMPIPLALQREILVGTLVG